MKSFICFFQSNNTSIQTFWHTVICQNQKASGYQSETDPQLSGQKSKGGWYLVYDIQPLANPAYFWDLYDDSIHQSGNKTFLKTKKNLTFVAVSQKAWIIPPSNHAQIK